MYEMGFLRELCIKENNAFKELFPCIGLRRPLLDLYFSAIEIEFALLS